MIAGRDVLLTQKKDHIYIMTVNREERRNAISNELMDRMAEEWERVEEDDDIWVAIFTGAGDVAFSSGHDLKDLEALLQQTEGRGALGREKAHEHRRSAYRVLARI